MNFFKSKQAKSSTSDHEHPIHHVLNHLQTHFTNFVRIPNPFSSKPDNPCPTLKTASSSSSDHSKESVVDDDGSCKKNLSLSLSGEEIKQRLNEVSVYRMCYSDPQVILPVESELYRRKAVFYFFSESDAQTFFSDCNTIEKNREFGLQLINVPLSEIIEAEGAHCTRLVPDMSQVKNALKEKEKAGFHGEKFYGVPVFQSDALKSTVDGTPNKLQQLFFRKEDLEKALIKEKQMIHTDDTQREIIQVMALEDIIQEMKDCSPSMWNDAVFIPPGNEEL